MAPLTLKRLFGLFFRVGNLTFGGGDPTMAALHSELVSRRGWIGPSEYGLVYALARLTPGTNLLAFCAGIGWRVRGWPGALATVPAVSAPSAAVVVWFTYGYQTLRPYPLAVAAIEGILAAAVGMMGAAAWNLAAPHLKSRYWLRAIAIISGSIILSLRFSISPIQILALSAAVGLLDSTAHS